MGTSPRDEDQARLSMDIPAGLHQMLRVSAAARDVNLRELVIEMAQRFLQHDPYVAAFQQVQQFETRRLAVMRAQMDSRRDAISRITNPAVRRRALERLDAALDDPQRALDETAALYRRLTEIDLESDAGAGPAEAAAPLAAAT